MPRLLLVDDNPSIHRIAESLLAPTDIELTCADSAEDALDRLARGERFDVALVDTAMPGMDGWTLLTRLRAMEATAHLPIALMAGVLDPVDPAKLAKAPVQGFLKKPIELRELGDRVKALLAMPVPPPADTSPFSTMPATSIKDLLHSEDAVLPEFRPETTPAFPEASPAAAFSEVDGDVLVLGPDDLWPEAGAELPGADLPDVQLELEELDLESLQDLTDEPLLPNEPEPIPELVAELDLTEEQSMGLPAIESVALPEDLQDLPLVSPHDTQDLDELVELVELDMVSSEAKPFEFVPEAALAPAPLPDSFEDDELDLLLEATPEPAAGGQSPAAEGQPEEQPVPAGALPHATGSDAQAMLQALLAEPVLMDALVKALVARMGDQVLREVAWEVMPELAGRLQR
jgi:CheY-like chemotaxis protein